MTRPLPVHYFVDYTVLFTAAAPEVNTGGFNALMSQQVG